jgi:predicted DsbA family dithiol-disulfide isomerase
MQTMTVDIFADVVCPWCWLGKRRLERAAALRPDLHIEPRWHAYQLDPSIPAGGLPRREYYLRKFGSAERIAAMQERLETLGADEAVPFAFDRITRSPNTRDAHRLIAGANGHQAALVERLYRAYFTDGLDIGSPTVLADLAGEAGLDRAEAVRQLDAGAGAEAVDGDLGAAGRIGISGVPFFIFDRKYALSGAAEPETLAEVMDKVLAERTE